jgi:hypothetical protein
MNIEFTQKEIEDIFHSSLCNAVSTGWMAGYGLELVWDEKQYDAAKASLQQTLSSKEQHLICYEDVLVQILREGGSLTFIDHEGGGAYTKSIVMADIFNKFDDIPVEVLANFITEDDDVESADVVLQTIFYDDVIFG